MRALLDEQLSPDIAAMLCRRGHDVVAVVERADLVAATDRALFELATRDERVMITNNVKDFRPLAAEWLARGREHPGLVLMPGNRRRTRAASAALVESIHTIFGRYPGGLVSGECWLPPGP